MPAFRRARDCHRPGDGFCVRDAFSANPSWILPELNYSLHLTKISLMKTINVNVASLKAKLSEYLRLVQKGNQVIVLDHKHPIATLAPIETGQPDLISVKPIEDPGLKGFFPSSPKRRPV